MSMRSRVVERLRRAARFPIVLLVAPAGFGKSVALRDFLEAADMSAVRFNVRRDQGTLLAFVRGLCEALADIAPTALAAFPATQQSILAGEEPVRQLSDWFAEHLRHAACTIAIDDLHLAATDRASIALLSDLIERTVPRIRWIAAARSDAGLPIATWIAYGNMDMPVNEDDLRFTPTEALDVASELRYDIDEREVDSLRDLTDGWPVALAIALRTRTHASDLQAASSGAREMVYRYLAEQVFATLTPDEQEFATRSAVFTTFDTAIAAELGIPPVTLAELRAKIAFLAESAPGEYRYHDLFRDFLETQLRRAGDERYAAAHREGAAILERRGELSAALLLYAKSRARSEIVRVLESAGFDLFESGRSDALAAALAALPESDRRERPAICGLHAMLEAARGHFEIAAGSYRHAIENARENDVLSTLVLRYAIELVRQGRDCVSLLEPFARSERFEAGQQAPLLGTLATAYAREGRAQDAAVAIARALDLLPASANDNARARLFHQAAYVYQFAGERERTQRYATLAVELAGRRNLYELAARAYSILYRLAYERDDATGCLKILDQLGEAARKAASLQARLFGLVAAYELQTERGDEAALTALESDIAELQAIFTPARTESLQPALALQAAWRGDFAAAYELRVATTREQVGGERQSLRFAETAFYAAAAGQTDASDDAHREAVAALERAGESTVRTEMARVFLALADLLRGRHAAAHRFIAHAEQGTRFTRVRAFARAARALYRMQLGQAEMAELDAALDHLRAFEFGGIARLLTALPLNASAPGGGYLALTPAERDVLQLLAAGASTKDIAAKTKRSNHTVDTHIRSICRKLQCSGRREAVALAVSAGWVHT